MVNWLNSIIPSRAGWYHIFKLTEILQNFSAVYFWYFMVVNGSRQKWKDAWCLNETLQNSPWSHCFVMADLAEELPLTTFILASCYRRRFKSNFWPLTFREKKKKETPEWKKKIYFKFNSDWLCDCSLQKFSALKICKVPVLISRFLFSSPTFTQMLAGCTRGEMDWPVFLVTVTPATGKQCPGDWTRYWSWEIVKFKTFFRVCQKSKRSQVWPDRHIVVICDRPNCKH